MTAPLSPEHSASIDVGAVPSREALLRQTDRVSLEQPFPDQIAITAAMQYLAARRVVEEYERRGAVIPAYAQDGDAVAAEVLRKGGTVTLTFDGGEYGRGGYLPAFGADALSRDGEYLAAGSSVMSPADALASLAVVARLSNETAVQADSDGCTARGGPVGARVDISAVLKEGGSLTVDYHPGAYAATLRDFDGAKVGWGGGATPSEALTGIHGSWGSSEADCSDEPPF